MTTGRSGEEARLVLTRTQPVDLTNSFLRLWLKIDRRTSRDMTGILIKVGSGNSAFENTAYQEIAEANEFLWSTIKPGAWTPVTLGTASFVQLLPANKARVDFAALRDFEVAIAGAVGRQVMLSFGGMEVVAADKHFPRGVISFTFDDGYESQYLLAAPILEARGFTATAYVIRDVIESTTSGLYMGADQLKDLSGRGWEIAAHADLIADHNAPSGFASLPTSQLISDWTAQRTWLSELGFSGVRDIAYPQGLFDNRVLGAIQRFGQFDTARTTDFRSVETLPPGDWHRLRCYGYDRTVAIGPPSLRGSLQWKVDQVAQFGGWLILAFHEITTERAGGIATNHEGSSMSVASLQVLADYIAMRGIPVRTVRQVWASQPVGHTLKNARRYAARRQ
jgi:peptidoglycan/xylan/chitin deacetylase (PgdA/CDA1 family)